MESPFHLHNYRKIFQNIFNYNFLFLFVPLRSITKWCAIITSKFHHFRVIVYSFNHFSLFKKNISNLLFLTD